MEVCAIRHGLVGCMSAEILPMGIDKSVLRQCFENWLSVPCTHFPPRNVLHEVSFLITITANLFEIFAIAFGEQQRIQRQLSGSHFDGLTLMLSVVQKVEISCASADTYE